MKSSRTWRCSQLFVGSRIAIKSEGPLHLQVSVPYLRSEYGKDYDFDAPVKLLDSMMHSMADQPNQQVVVLGQVRPVCLCLPAGDHSLPEKPVRQGCGC